MDQPAPRFPFPTTATFTSVGWQNPLSHGDTFSKVCLSAWSASLASVATNPLDVLKTRMQINLKDRTGGVHHKDTGIVSHCRQLWRQERWRALGQGLTSNILRSCSYSAICLGTSDLFLHSITSLRPENRSPLSGRSERSERPIGFGDRVVAGMAAGSLAAFLSNPIELLRVHRQTGSRVSFSTLLRQEGWSVMWRGSSAHVQRCAIWAGIQLSTYGQTKSLLINSGYFGPTPNTSSPLPPQPISLHLCASFLCGLVTVTAAHPLDNLKARLMIMTSQSEGTKNHKSSSSSPSSSLTRMAQQVWRQEGLRGFYRGWWPNYLRSGSHATLMFLCFEQSRRWLGFDYLK